MGPCLACIRRKMRSIVSTSATAAKSYSAVPKPPKTNVHDGSASEPKPRARSSRKAEAWSGRSTNSDQSGFESRVLSFGSRRDTETASSSKSSSKSGRALTGNRNGRLSERQGQGSLSFGLRKDTIIDSTSSSSPDSDTSSIPNSGWRVGRKRNHLDNEGTTRISDRLYPPPPSSRTTKEGSRRNLPPLSPQNSGTRYHEIDEMSSLSFTKAKESPILDFANLPRHPSPRSQIHFVGLHHSTAISAFHRPSSPSVPIIKYRDKYLHLRATPTHILPEPPHPPFPSSTPQSGPASEGTYAERHPGRLIVPFGVVASKSGVSPIAPERGRVRKRIKAAVEGVINRSWGLQDGQDGRELVQPDWSYLAVLNREVYDATMPELCGSLLAGFQYIRRQQRRGIGSKLEP